MPTRFPSHSTRSPLRQLAFPGVLALLLCAGWLPAAAGPLALLARWLGLMVAPGAALGLTFSGRQARGLEVAIAAFLLSPVALTLAAIAALAAGVEPGLIARGGAIVSLLSLPVVAALRRTTVSGPRHRELLSLGALALVLVALTVFLPATREWWRMRSDAWFHAAVVTQIDHYGIPPTDPYFAGLPLQYMWFYHVLVLVLSRGLGTDVFSAMALVNVQALVGLVLAAYLLSGVFRERFAHRFGATLVLLFGFNAAFWVFLPLKLLKVVSGEVRGWEEIRRTYSLLPLDYSRACGFMNIYYNQEFFLDKFMVATAFGLSLTFMTAAWHAASAWLRERRRFSLFLLASTLIGMLGFHSLVGFVMLVGLFGGAVLLFLARSPLRDYRPRDSIVMLALSLAVLLAMTPYLWEVMHLKEREQVFPLNVSLSKTGGIFISSAFVLFLGWRGRAFFRASDSASRFFSMGMLSVTVFCLLIALPGPNTYDKLGYFVFIPLSIVAGFALADALVAPARRVAALMWTLAFLVPVNAIAFAGCFATADGVAVTPDEARLSGWLREHTPRDALLIDDDDRVPFLVTVPRRYVFGSWAYAWQWGYPKAEMSRRLHALRALYSPGPIDATALEVLGEVREPLYAIVRPEHRERGAALLREAEFFDLVHDDGALGVVRIDTAACRDAAARRRDRLSIQELIRDSGL